MFIDRDFKLPPKYLDDEDNEDGADAGDDDDGWVTNLDSWKENNINIRHYLHTFNRCSIYIFCIFLLDVYYDHYYIYCYNEH